MKVSKHTLVSIIYDMYIGTGDARKLKEKATRGEPVKFIFGEEMMISGIENALDGLEVGDKFNFTLQPEDAYGERSKANIIELPRSSFEINGRLDSLVIYRGNTIQMLDAEGKRLNCTVVEVGEEMITVDFNHPLAGETLHFTGEVINVHIPSKEEKNLYYSEVGCGCEEDACSGCAGCH
jgi:FKBP-type peptidyl-prolyl cis-trans isomerase SlyD